MGCTPESNLPLAKMILSTSPSLPCFVGKCLSAKELGFTFRMT